MLRTNPITITQTEISGEVGRRHFDAPLSARLRRLSLDAAIAASAVTLFSVSRPRAIEDRAAKAVLRSSIGPPIPSFDNGFTPRPALSDRINQALDKFGFVVIEGPRGCGKTSCVRDALTDRAGVVHFSTWSHLDPSSKVLKALSETLDPWSRSSRPPLPLTKDQLFEVCRKTTALRQPYDASWRPTIVVETSVMGHVGDYVGSRRGRCLQANDYGDYPTDYGSMVTMLQHLSLSKLANVVIVLSDDDAAFAVTDADVDHGLGHRLWVDDFSEAEAHAYLDKIEALPCNRANAADPNLALRNEVFHELGTRPASLTRAASEWLTPSFAVRGLPELIRIKKAQSEGDIFNLCTFANGKGAAFTRLIDDLLETTDEVGVPIERARQYLVSPDDIRDGYLRTKGTGWHRPWHTVLYHRPTDTYRFNSVDKRRAAERRTFYHRPTNTWRLVSTLSSTNADKTAEGKHP